MNISLIYPASDAVLLVDNTGKAYRAPSYKRAAIPLLRYCITSDKRELFNAMTARLEEHRQRMGDLIDCVQTEVPTENGDVLAWLYKTERYDFSMWFSEERKFVRIARVRQDGEPEVLVSSDTWLVDVRGIAPAFGFL
jgi:hypothetical protein